MTRKPGPLRGRGSAENPRNRFYTRSVEPDPEAVDPDEPLPHTEFIRDASRSIIATNDSPDVPFEASINPYRGCEHGCVYCLSGDTRILMSDGNTRPLSEVQPGDWIYGTVRSGWYRKYIKTQVLAHWKVRKFAYRVSLEDGTQIIAGGDHRFLTERGWKFVTDREGGHSHRAHLTLNNKLMGIGKVESTPRSSTTPYQRGYLCGLIRGDGHLGTYCYINTRPGRTEANQFRFRLAMIDDQPLARASEYLAAFGVETDRFQFTQGSANRKPVAAIRTSSDRDVTRIEEIVAWPTSPSPDWVRGFLGGIYDAEGSLSCGVLRIANKDNEIIFRTQDCLKQFDFRFRTEESRGPMEVKYVRLLGGLGEHLRFFQTVQPAIPRKRDFEGARVKSQARLGVVAVTPLNRTEELFDVTTGTGDFIANGVVSHNCYARPFHEFLGFSAGLDFETKILVKEDAPELLRNELSSRRWKPKLLALSGVTDPYQPVERRLQLTRRCIEVLAEFRNPVVIITKNHLVTRDADLLGSLAKVRAARVLVSITTLDPKLTGKMEPRTSTPARRLDAIARLAQAGVPVGVNVAPIIPGLTDHEVPGILKAAAKAGATFAGHIVLRLPHGVKDLFEKWLGDHFPERKEKVLHRVREVRGGKLYDPFFGSRMSGTGEYADQIHQLFRLGCRKAGLANDPPELSTASFKVPPGPQLELF